MMTTFGIPRSRPPLDRTAPLPGGPLRRSRLALWLPALLAASAIVIPATAAGPAKHYPLDSADGLLLHNVAAHPATHEGRKGLRLTIAPDTARRLEEKAPPGRAQVDLEQLARIEGLEFSNGVIDAELTGAPAPGAGEGARGFVGIAFRLQDDWKTYDAFYLRPTNGRAHDQERRNRSVQYISHPDWPWFRLRKETPGRYESYADLVPGEWTKVRIEVRGTQARLYVHGHEQPALVVNDVKTGGDAKGAVALWVGPGTVAHFRNLVVTP